MVAGGNMVYNAKILKQTNEFAEFKSAYDSFKLQYKALPGDFSKASQYWGATIPNGNGNFTTATGSDHGMNPNVENFLFFYHLTLSGLINKRFENVNELGVGYPELIISPGKGYAGGGIITGSAGYQQSVTATFTSALEINIGRPTAGGCCAYNNNHGTSNAETFYNIDKKVDDGDPNNGIFQSYKVWSSYNGDCLTAVDGDYLLSNKNPACVAVYVLED